jgi:hypothetical protein
VAIANYTEQGPYDQLPSDSYIAATIVMHSIFNSQMIDDFLASSEHLPLVSIEGLTLNGVV